MTYYSLRPSPFGELLMLGNGRALTALYMPPHRHAPQLDTPASLDWRRDDSLFHEAGLQLDAYFAGQLQHFNLPLAATGTPFQQRVWRELLAIPFGETRSYGQLAQRLGMPGASRAVGLANGRNPLSIIVPCHRVIGADGSLTGYGGGLERKRWLLAHEQAHSPYRLN
ncbi:MAG: methylated-DNA--[protein]-cysteine S-methyltransferase [Pseudomonas sp.]|uniref:methylated-DNA--[protein]-cysteine S-methyltransferase n=1 Tax=Pseudomonas sp. TaxID=306 RepID=UPI00339A0EA7